MKTTAVIMAPILLLFAHAPVCAGGAFGLEMGMPIEQIDGDALELRPGWYRVMSVPKPHPAFAFYFVKMCPVHGLSQVQAVCLYTQSSSYESEVVSMFRDMRSGLEKRNRLVPNTYANDVDRVGLGYMCGSSETRITLEYYFGNHESCDAGEQTQ